MNSFFKLAFRVELQFNNGKPDIFFVRGLKSLGSSGNDQRLGF